MKARWVLSLANAAHYPGAKEYFYNLGIETKGFIQWQAPPYIYLPCISPRFPLYLPISPDGLHPVAGNPTNPKPNPKPNPNPTRWQDGPKEMPGTNSSSRLH